MDIVEELRFWQVLAEKSSESSLVLAMVSGEVFEEAAEVIELMQAVIDAVVLGPLLLSYHNDSTIQDPWDSVYKALDDLAAWQKQYQDKQALEAENSDFYDEEVGRGC